VGKASRSRAGCSVCGGKEAHTRTRRTRMRTFSWSFNTGAAYQVPSLRGTGKDSGMPSAVPDNHKRMAGSCV
jgi:hypothetical protein